MAETTFKRHERIVGRKIEEVANSSCIRAIRKELQLTKLAEAHRDSGK